MSVYVRGYHPPIYFQANGLLSSFGLAPTPGTWSTTTGPFDGTREQFVGLRISTIVLQQRLDGSSGSSTVELFRRRSGSQTQIATNAAITLAAGGGALARLSTSPTTETLRTIEPGDILLVQLTAAQVAGEDLTLTVSFT